MSDEIKINNEKIARFMGIVFKKEINGEKYYTVPASHIQSYNASQGNFGYHRSWDWLMPVVDNILKMKLYSVAFVTLRAKRIGSPIHEVYDAVVEFIDWHNAQNKTE